MYQRLQNLRQNSRSLDDYTTEFHQLVARNDLAETEEQLVSRYVGGLREQFQFTLNMFELFSVSDACQKALQIEKQASRRPFSTPWSTTAALFLDSDGVMNEQCESYEQEVAYDEEVVEEVVGDNGPLLVVRRLCYAPREAEGDSWLRDCAAAFQGGCTQTTNWGGYHPSDENTV
ncbi:hypothetical protein Vadar_032047 [Vaccinium darrowii]|uniref:Uncharacterized protein n=1 Tax=Vaccinium darrowii TaxID=229202 RepID=A0ACB7YHF7_9ERIC|nr:hypothetical protein Vadar_032047 [Vaccinium darrowii]